MRSRLIQLMLAAALIFTIPFQITSAKSTTLALAMPASSSLTHGSTSPEHTQEAEFVLVNATSSWLSLFVDGERTVTVNPGDRGVALVSVGSHHFRAVATDGRSVERSGYVSPAGVTWTIHQ